MAKGPLTSKAQVESYERFKAAYAAVGITVDPPPAGGAADRLLKGDDEWSDECHVCGKGGKLLCCAFCAQSAHKKCYGLKKQPKGDWVCEDCVEERARAGEGEGAYRTGFSSDDE